MRRVWRAARPGGLLWRALGVFAPIVVLAAGCWSGASRPKTVPVYGKVTYCGEPVTKGKVMFQPVKPAEGLPVRPATGELRSDGSFEMSSFESDDGVVPGQYRVSIMSLLSGPTPDNPNAPKVWGVPQKYANPLQSGLQATVPVDAEGRLEMNFDLQD